MKWYYKGWCLIPQCPPKNWEARSWSGEGRRPSGTLHSTGFALDRACGSSSSSSSSKCVWLPWPWWSWLARTVVRESSGSERSLGRALDRTRIQGSQTGAPPGQLDPQLDRVEFPLFGLDQSGGRVGASGLRALPPSL
ncbi:unnamed protein product [Microthlaspi erraticum]|uniref:Uncharacterized protein n=1 Tax=Microthlaspi erraticum TaxID=1685480 RepID=A0A6D2JW67_9BRAS|nr:unnamed protein product [Microthlaspi erraticum]